MKRLNSLRVVARAILLMASTFLGIGCIPDRLTQYPRYSISSAQKVDFSALHHQYGNFSDSRRRQTPTPTPTPTPTRKMTRTKQQFEFDHVDDLQWQEKQNQSTATATTNIEIEGSNTHLRIIAAGSATESD
jgi:hypothetical protein